MALLCQLSLNYASYAAGQNPPPQITLTVVNNGAVAVSVTGVAINCYVLGDTRRNSLAMSPNVAPIGPGMTTSVPARAAGVNGSITIGPFPIVVGSAANVNSFQAVNQTGNLNPVNPQGSQPPQYRLMIGANVTGSDGSVNAAGEVGLLVSYTSAPPVGWQGGFLNFSAPNNAITGFLAGVF